MRILGIDIGGTKTAVCLGDETGRVLLSRRRPSRAAAGFAAWLTLLEELVAELLAAADLTVAEVDVIGLSAPGPLSTRTGCLLQSPNMPGWEQAPLVDAVSARYGRPVYMNNDANGAAEAEWLFGRYAGYEPLIYLTMSTGLGAGIIANGGLLQGASDTAGEVGFHILDLAGPAWSAGHSGSFESYCGGRHLAERLRTEAQAGRAPGILAAGGGDPAQIDFAVFLRAVQAGDEVARRYWEEYLLRLAQGIGNLILILNPRVVLLGTIALHAGDFLLEPLRALLPRFVFPQALAACEILPCSLGTEIGDRAALAIALSGMRAAEKIHDKPGP